jgi:hypothetical protein
MFDAEKETGLPLRFAWAMFFGVCDREGRFKWMPRSLKAEVLPLDELDFSHVLDAWLTRDFIVKYRIGSEWYGYIPTFKIHQYINNKEPASVLPDISLADEVVTHACLTGEPRVVGDALLGTGGREGKGRERKGKTHAPTQKQIDAKDPLIFLDLFSIEFRTHPLFPDCWARWVQHRKEVRAPIHNLKTGAAEMIRTLEPLGPDRACEVIIFSLSKGWKGLFPDGDKKPGGFQGRDSAGVAMMRKMGAMNGQDIGIGNSDSNRKLLSIMDGLSQPGLPRRDDGAVVVGDGEG